MARTKGNVPYSGSLEVTIKAPLDARRVVQLKSDLYKDETWRYLGTPEKPDNSLYLYKGLDVIVCGDTDENNGIYVLMNVGGFTQESAWEKKTGSTSITIPNIVPKGNYDDTPDVVYNSGDMVNVGGVMYICTEDGTTNIKPTVTAGWTDHWAVFQLKGSEGKAGEAPYINQATGEWEILKTDGSIHKFGVKALGVNGLTPRIQDGFWYIGDIKKNRATGTSITIQKVGDTYNWFLDGRDSGVQAIGEPGKAAIANINYCGKWNTTTTYTNNNARTGKTDVVLGSDNKMYAALNPTIVGAATNPVNDTTNINWGLFAMYGSDGTPGNTPYIKDGFWYIGTETVNDKTTGQAVRAEGSILSISSDGYWEINGNKTDKPASITTITERQISTTQNVTNIVENTINNINPRGIFDPAETYYHTNVAEDNKTDVVVGSDGKGYFCLAESTSINPVGDTTQSWALFSIAGTPGNNGDTPELIPDAEGNYWWYISGNNQWVKANGKDGVSISGTNGRDPYIKENGMWAFQRLALDGKTVIEELETTIKAEVDQPNIREGMWFVGDTPTFVQAKGESAIANINFREAWKAGEQYWNKNANANNWTDLVDGADDNKYYCKVNHTSTSANNPCIQVDGVWVRNTATAATNVWGKWSIKGSTGADGKPTEMRWFEGKLQWRVQGTETWSDLLNIDDLRRETLSDISTPIGSVIMYSGKAVEVPEGYLLCNGNTIQKTDYPDLVKVLSGTNTATSVALPDLSGRFVVGYTNDTVWDPNTKGPYENYNEIGKKGGVFEVKLTAKQSGLPEHQHKYDTVTDKSGGERAYYANKKGNPNTLTSKAGGVGAEEAHTNLPPYYVLAYIIKANYKGEEKTPYNDYLKTVPEGTTPLSRVDWLETMKGQTGIAGINPRGNYSNTTPYYDHDTVVIVNPENPELGNSFSCIVEGETGVTGVEPGVTAGWENSWARLVLRGAKGDNAPEVLVRYSASASTAEGSDWHAIPTVSDKYIRFSTNGTVGGLGTPMLVKGDNGNNALPIKLQYSTDDTTWSDTAAATSKYIRFGTYSNEGVLSWSSTISIASGSSVFTQDIKVNLSSGKLGKYSSGQTILSNGKTFEEVLRDIAIESIPPTIVGTSITGTLPYNHPLSTDSDYTKYVTDNPVALTVNFGTITIKNTGATAKTKKLYYNRDGGSTWIEIVDAAITLTSTSYTHSVNALLGENNTAAIYYKLVFTDSTDASAAITVNKTVSAYAAATYTIGTAYVTTREMGDVSTRIKGTINFTPQRIGVDQYSEITSRALMCRTWNSVNSTWNAWTTPYSFVNTDKQNIDYTHNDAALKDATKIEYQIYFTTSKPAGQVEQQLIATTALGGTINLSYNRYYGVGASAPTNVGTAAALRTAVVNSNPVAIATGTFDIYTGTSAKIWICLPPGRTLATTAYDVSANANFVFSAGVDYIMNDAGGNARTFKMYEATSGFSNTHQIRITIS